MKYLLGKNEKALIKIFNTLTKKECMIIWNPMAMVFTFEVIKAGKVHLICHLMKTKTTKGETETILVEIMGSIKDAEVGLMAYKKEIIKLLKTINKIPTNETIIDMKIGDCFSYYQEKTLMDVTKTESGYLVKENSKEIGININIKTLISILDVIRNKEK